MAASVAARDLMATAGVPAAYGVGAPAKIEGHLAQPICSGPPLPKEAPRVRKASCCYPAKELLVRPIRAVYPTLRACYQARAKQDAEGRVVFSFRVEQDGSVRRVCTGESTTMDDEGAVRCMVDAMRKAHFESMSDEERDFCGLISFNYPVMFEP